MRCSYGTCRREAKYLQGWFDPNQYRDGSTTWGLVCATHDTMLGVMNLMDGFGLSRSGAAELNREMDREWRAEVRAAKYGVEAAT